MSGNSQLEVNNWYYVAYVYKRAQSSRVLCINEKQDRLYSPLSAYIGNASNLTLGTALLNAGSTVRSGYIDKLTFVSRTKNDSEIFEEATLVAYYSFDNTNADSAPSQINNTTGESTSFSLTGRLNQSLYIQASSLNVAYFKANGFYFLS